LDDSWLPFLASNFLVSWNAVVEDGRWWTLLTSVFSHNLAWHLLLNMLVLQSFGSLLERVLGRWRYLRFYLFAGVMGSVWHCCTSRFLLGQPQLDALGASGALAGLVLVFSLLFPREKILVFGLVPVPALWGALAFVGLDIWGLIAQAGGEGLPIGHGAHLGGAFAGIVYYFLLKRNAYKIRR